MKRLPGRDHQWLFKGMKRKRRTGIDDNSWTCMKVRLVGSQRGPIGVKFTTPLLEARYSVDDVKNTKQRDREMLLTRPWVRKSDREVGSQSTVLKLCQGYLRVLDVCLHLVDGDDFYSSYWAVVTNDLPNKQGSRILTFRVWLGVATWIVENVLIESSEEKVR